MFAALVASTIIASGLITQSLADNSNKVKEPKTATPIQHLVIIFGENRSLDHYFATYPVALKKTYPCSTRKTIHRR